jgi:two-component system response regulator PilR (NtrC family)
LLSRGYNHIFETGKNGNGFASVKQMLAKDLSRKRILIIEDDPTMQKAIKLILKSDLYDLEDARSGEEAKQIISEKRFDLIITDLFLNGITGLDIFKEYYQHIPVLIITGYGNSALAKIARQEAGMSYLEKSFNAETLKKKVSELLTKK